MEKLTPDEITTVLLGFALMLGLARAFGEAANRLGQPDIVGEILAGILLGPTVFGALFPDLAAQLFPSIGAVSIAFDTMIMLAVVLLLLIAGLEIDLSVLWRQGRVALLVSVMGTVVPFAVGFGAAYAVPEFWGRSPGADTFTFALFFGTALSISALPVIAKILMDLNLFKTDAGMLIMAAAMFSDLVGWIIFSIVLGLMSANPAPGAEAGLDGGHGGFGVGTTIALTLGLVVFVLTAGRWLVHRSLPWIQSRLSWPGGVLSFTLVLALAGAAATEAIGIHAIFGAFLAGIAVGDSAHLREQTRTVLHQFVTYIFAPIFFVSIGLQANFLAAFNVPLILGVLGVAFLGKLAGCLIGARWGGLTRNEGWAIGFGMNARGAMEIILGLLALQYGVIEDEMFIALVVLALLSSVISGPMMSLFIKQRKQWLLEDLLTSDLFIPNLTATTREEAIRELATPAAAVSGLAFGTVEDAVQARERIMGTSIGHEVAVPHARMDHLTRPVLVVGRSKHGIDFDSPDGRPSRLVFLLLTPRQDDAAQLQIMGQIARIFQHEESRELLYETDSVDVIRAHVKTQPATAAAIVH